VAEQRTRLSLHAEIQPTGVLRFAEGAIRERVGQELPSALLRLRADIERQLPAARR
jgi:hypothetical protein